MDVSVAHAPRLGACARLSAPRCACVVNFPVNREKTGIAHAQASSDPPAPAPAPAPA